MGQVNLLNLHNKNKEKEAMKKINQWHKKLLTSCAVILNLSSPASLQAMERDIEDEIFSPCIPPKSAKKESGDKLTDGQLFDYDNVNPDQKSQESVLKRLGE